MQTATLSKVSKAYNGVPALNDVSLSLTGGRVHALMGENGAGKSTFIKLAAGVVPADSIELSKDGASLPLEGPQDAHVAGFRFIHQELNIVPQVSVAENILLGRILPKKLGLFVNWAHVRKTAQDALDKLGATHINVSTLAGDLPAGDKMLVKIAAALVTDEGEAGADIYVLDEPTAALTGAESEMLFNVIERLKQSGAAILYVSHRMDEVLRICDDVTVLRDGKHISTTEICNTSKEEIIHAMTGRDVKDSYPPRTSTIGDDTVAVAQGARTKRLSDLNFALRAGEILGVGGLAEAGQTELLRLFLGLETIVSGSFSFNGQSCPTSPSEAWSKDIAYIPRERRSEALMLDMSIRDNTLLPHYGANGFKAKKGKETARAQEMAQKVRLKYDGPGQPVGQLSGGNQQKVVFARALCGNPKLLLLEEPTRGVDVGAKFEIYQLVRGLSAAGCAVILTSTDLPEILGMCDRVLVLQDGQQAHLLDRGDMTAADLLTYFYSDDDAEGRSQ
ncbi:sugar ABC transporter ATP-binding protein [Gymnodinialimonas sp. 57CJ19]|uniref:sugar ABC transporter ATP-binding protein n=1 Tax=Gymnodinialimonas sp. 57CJ19 TaxID=3138498 RepID=UPI0031344208